VVNPLDQPWTDADHRLDRDHWLIHPLPTHHAVYLEGKSTPASAHRNTATPSGPSPFPLGGVFLPHPFGLFDRGNR
jgi:hypothetical protein